MRLLKYTFVLMGIFSVFTVIAQEKINMQLQLKKGDAYRVTIPMSAPMQVEAKLDPEAMKKLLLNMGIEEDSVEAQIKSMEKDKEANQTMQMNMSMEMCLLFKVIETTSEKYTLEAYYEYLETSVQAKDETYSISTRKKSEGLNENQEKELNSLKNIIGKKFKVNIDSRGKLLSLEGYDKILKAAKIKKSKDFLSNENSMLSDQLQTDEINTTMSGIFDILPPSEVKIGSTWTKDISVKDELTPYTIKTKYTLKEIRKDDVVILSESVFYNNLEDAKLVTVDGTGSGNITMKRADYFQQEQPYNYELKMNMKLFGMNMNIATPATGTYKVEKL